MKVSYTPHLAAAARLHLLILFLAGWIGWLPLVCAESDEKPWIAPPAKTVPDALGSVRDKLRVCDDPSGALLLAAFMSREALLVSMDGAVLHTWKFDAPLIGPPQLLSDGSLVGMVPSFFAGKRKRATPRGGDVVRLDPDGKRIWRIRGSTDDHAVHLGVHLLENGHLLAPVRIWHSKEDWVAHGRAADSITPAGMFSDGVWELKPDPRYSARILWSWNQWNWFHENEHPPMRRAEFQTISINSRPEPDPYGMGISRLLVLEQLKAILVFVPDAREIWVLHYDSNSPGGIGGPSSWPRTGATGVLAKISTGSTDRSKWETEESLLRAWVVEEEDGQHARIRVALSRMASAKSKEPVRSCGIGVIELVRTDEGEKTSFDGALKREGKTPDQAEKTLPVAHAVGKHGVISGMDEDQCGSTITLGQNGLIVRSRSLGGEHTITILRLEPWELASQRPEKMGKAMKISKQQLLGSRQSSLFEGDELWSRSLFPVRFYPVQ